MWHSALESTTAKQRVLFRNAVRLVDGQETDVEPLENPLEGPELEPFGSHEKDIEPSGGRPVERRPAFGRTLRCAQMSGPQPRFPSPLDLVLHERDERRDHERETTQCERRHLVADALAPAGREDAQGVPAGEDRPY